MSGSAGFSENAVNILKARYYLKNEKGEFQDKSPQDLFRRVAEAIAAAEKTKNEREEMSGRFFDL
ncbi:MAG: hypothetical protein MUP19_07925, partial [Candidatus Aminicenantes bacterium]|nr:hypothetical protein [Candidatus Aminicenantes bacterium]